MKLEVIVRGYRDSKKVIYCVECIAFRVVRKTVLDPIPSTKTTAMSCNVCGKSL